MGTARYGSRKGIAERGISTVFRLISDLFTERRAELAARAKRHGAPANSGRGGAVLLEDIALENGGRLLELDELANRISVLGFEHFRQRLDLSGAFELETGRTWRNRGARR